MQIEIARAALLLGCEKLGLQPTVEVVELKANGRWVLGLDQDPNFPDFGRNMIKLERYIKAHLMRPVDLILESMEDRNKRFKRNGRDAPKLRGVESI